MSDQRFTILLEKYLARTITPEETEELKALVLTGRYQHLFREDLTRFMEEQFSDPKEMPVPVDGDQLYAKILSRRNDRKPRGNDQPRQWYWVRAAAMLVLMLGAGWWFFSFPADRKQTLLSGKEPAAEEHIVRFTKKDFIKLPDGSTVLLNDNSELTYRLPFGEGRREVSLKGEAFFDIFHDSGNPFIVHTGSISTNVLGTAFNVNARNKNVVVTVERGLVQVADEDHTLSLVRPDERITVNTLTRNFEKTEVKAAEEIKWKSQSIIFDDIPLQEAVDLLRDRFGARIGIVNPAIENCRIKAWFLENESLDEILEMVCGIRQAQYTKKDGVITISGGIACEP